MRIRSVLVSSFAGIMVALAACAGGSPLEPGAGAYPGYTDMPGSATLSKGSGSGSGTVSGTRLVYCKPFDEAQRSATIGLLGGTLKIGPHTLVIPPGALLSPKTITAKIAKNDYSNSVQFSPEGLQFVVPALLTLSYANCDQQTMLQQLQVVYTSDDLLRILDLLPSIQNPFNKTTTGTVRHFSRYAVAY